MLSFIGYEQLCNGMHLKGGWIQYEFLGTDTAAKTNKYKITVRQYLSCTSTGAQIDADIYLGIFDAGTNLLYQKLTVLRTRTEQPSITTFDPCIDPAPSPGAVCYRIDIYETTVTLPYKDAGYILAVQRCCRIGGIVNLVNSDQLGVTYYNKIPGKINGVDYSNNSSPEFQPKDTVIVCRGTPFTFDFSATDSDADSLAYIFCNGLHGGNAGSSAGARPDPPANPPYSSVTYATGFDGSSPMGPAVTINPKTGLITGTAPATTGDYTVAVCALEYRGGVIIGVNKKEIHINVANCQLSAAELKPNYTTCDGFTLSFQNESGATNITQYKWDFGITSITTDTSSSPTPTYTYPDTGVYKLKLWVKSTGCSDSTESLVRIFPGFVPNFTAAGFCYQNPFQFTNTTFAQYGMVDSVHWDFGEISAKDDTSILKNPSYKYPTPGIRQVRLYAHSSKGCEKDTVKNVTVLDKPIITLPFKDTLICSIDTLPLQSSSNGTTYKWSPNYNITNTNIPNPKVYPKDTTRYILTVTDKGCINRDTITVNVLDYITVDAGLDNNICLTDTFTMRTVSYALSYIWTPGATLIDSTIKYAQAIPTAPVTTYYVKANLGKCQAGDSVKLFTSPYPIANAGRDTSICFGDTVRLKGSISGTDFKWTPPISIIRDANTLTPLTQPQLTTNYILMSRYLAGCVKPKYDTVNVNVIQPFTVYAGKDTSVVYAQPLQLFANVFDNSNKKYKWTSIPAGLTNYLTSDTLQNPVATLPLTVDSLLYIVKAYTKENCFDLDTIKIIVFKSQPDIFMPDAFTPNGVGPNDIYKPITVGITRLDYFHIYNRWGQQLFTTTQIGKGWDGKFNGKDQDMGTYVYMVQGVDYFGKVITKKGTVVLIR